MNRLIVSKYRGFSSASPAEDLLTPGLFVIAIGAFCLISNLLMLIPPLLELIPVVSSDLSLQVNNFVMTALVVVIASLSFFGLAILLPWYMLEKGRFRFLDKVAIRYKVPVFHRFYVNGFQLIAASFLGFFFVIIKGDGLNGDTGLYHLPNVLHLSRLGIEWGMANWDLRYTTYSLQFFGQTPFQFILPVNSYVSPSLNIYFLSALLMLFFAAVQSVSLAKIKKAFGFRIQSLLMTMIIVFFSMSYIFGLEPRSSLVSFNPDFAISCVATIGIYYAVFTFSYASFVLAVLIAVLLPFLKITGLLASFVVLSVIGLRLLASYFHAKLRGTQNHFNISIIDLKKSNLFRDSFFLVVGFALILSSTFLLSSFVMTGYFLPKFSLLGPWGTHAVPISELADFLKQELLFNRTQGFNLSSADSLALASNPDEWFKYWRNSKEGKIMLGSLSLTIFSASLYLISLFFEKSRLPPLGIEVQQKGLTDKNDCNYSNCYGQKIDVNYLISANLSLSVALIVALVVGIFIGPPQSRFYSWSIGISLYLALSIVFLYPLLGATFWASVSTVAAVYIRSSALLEKSPVPVRFDKAEFIWKGIGVPRWRIRASNEGKGSRFNYSTVKQDADHGSGCWSIEPPCSSGKTLDYR